MEDVPSQSVDPLACHHCGTPLQRKVLACPSCGNVVNAQLAQVTGKQLMAQETTGVAKRPSRKPARRRLPLTVLWVAAFLIVNSLPGLIYMIAGELAYRMVVKIIWIGFWLAPFLLIATTIDHRPVRSLKGSANLPMQASAALAALSEALGKTDLVCKVEKTVSPHTFIARCSYECAKDGKTEGLLEIHIEQYASAEIGINWQISFDDVCPWWSRKKISKALTSAIESLARQSGKPKLISMQHSVEQRVAC